MKRYIFLLVLALASASFASQTITGNYGAWTGGNIYAEVCSRGVDPIFQNVTIPDPGPGSRWQVEELRFQAVAKNWDPGQTGNSTGFQAWLIPGTLIDGQEYVNNSAEAVAYFKYEHGGQLPVGAANAVNVTVANSDSVFLEGGGYYLEIRPLEEDIVGNTSYVGIGKVHLSDTYPGGAEGYYQWPFNPPTIDLNIAQDLSFEIRGSLVVTPEIVIAASDGDTVVSESGTIDSYTVVLGTVPAAQVTLVVEADTGDAQVQVSTTGGAPWSPEVQLDFFPADYDQPQTVWVQAIDDAIKEISAWPPDTHSSVITHTSYSSDTNYMNPGGGGTLVVAPVLVAIQDNDFPCGEPGMPFLAGDVNEDCQVDFQDFVLLGRNWQVSNAPEFPGMTAEAITGNPGSWDTQQAEELIGGLFPILQGVTLPDPGTDMKWQIDSLSFEAIGQDWWYDIRDGASGFDAFLIPGPTFGEGQTYVDRRPQAVARFTYQHGGQLPTVGPVHAHPERALPVTVPNGMAAFVDGGSYYLDINPLAADITGVNNSGLAIGHDGNADTYAGGVEGYVRGDLTIGINTTRDLSFRLQGTATAAEQITGNSGSWNGFDAEECPLGLHPVFQSVILPDPDEGQSWRIRTLKFDAVAQQWWTTGGSSHGFRAWLRPGMLSNGQVHNIELSDAVAFGQYVGTIPVGKTQAVPIALELDYCGFIPGGEYFLELRPLAEDIEGQNVSWMAFGRDGAANSYAGGAQGYKQWQLGTIGVNANHDLVFALVGEQQPPPTGGPTVTMPAPSSDPSTNRSQVLVGNGIDFTPPVGQYEAAWKMNDGAWSLDCNSVHRDFENEVYTYNDNYVTRNGALTTAWVEIGYPGIGGIVWHFQTDNPQYVQSNGGLAVDISSVYSLAAHPILTSGGEVGGHALMDMYFSDENSFATLSPMTGGVWEGATSGYQDPNGAAWQLLYTNRVYTENNYYLAQPDTVVSADGDFWVRLDLGLFSYDLFYDSPAYNALCHVQVKELQVKGRYNWPQTCEELWISGQGLAGDIDRNCIVDLSDFSDLAGDWLLCNDPQDADCTPNW